MLRSAPGRGRGRHYQPPAPVHLPGIIPALDRRGAELIISEGLPASAKALALALATRRAHNPGALSPAPISRSPPPRGRFRPKSCGQAPPHPRPPATTASPTRATPPPPSPTPPTPPPHTQPHPQPTHPKKPTPPPTPPPPPPPPPPPHPPPPMLWRVFIARLHIDPQHQTKVRHQVGVVAVRRPTGFVRIVTHHRAFLAAHTAA